jgi:hypothetical protein
MASRRCPGALEVVDLLAVIGTLGKSRSGIPTTARMAWRGRRSNRRENVGLERARLIVRADISDSYENL